MRRLCRRFFYIVLAVLGALLMFHLEENWRGQSAWTEWRRSREALGDSYEWADLLPLPIPDESNFAKAPALVKAIQGEDPESLLSGLPVLSLPKGGNWQTGEVEDLKAWQKALNTTDLPTGLNLVNARLDEIADAATRSGCHIPLPGEVDIPFLLGFRRLTMFYKARALARIAAGRPDLALEDVQTCLRIILHLEASPVLVTALLRNGMLRITLQAVWEGLEKRCWSQDQLVTLQRHLAEVDLLVSWRTIWQGERIFSLGRLEAAMGRSSWARARDAAMMWPSLEPAPSRLRTFTVWALIPKGWHYLNQKRFDKACLDLMDLAEPSRHFFYPPDFEKPLPVESGWFTFPDFLPALSEQRQRFARLQTGLDQAVVVCGLEQYRLEHGDYPEALDLLVPDVMSKLPTDVVTGEPLTYRHGGPNGFELSSSGWKGQAAGGESAEIWRWVRLESAKAAL